MNYSGKVNFEFEIERYKNKVSGELVTDITTDNEYLFDYELILLQVEGSSFFASGKYFGKPENCYPDEGDTEITSVTGPDQLDWEDKLTASERERIIQMISDQVQDQEPDYNEDDDDPPSF
jgi:hypothetical protein